jgi:hypothetical protein
MPGISRDRVAALVNAVFGVMEFAFACKSPAGDTGLLHHRIKLMSLFATIARILLGGAIAGLVRIRHIVVVPVLVLRVRLARLPLRLLRAGRIAIDVGLMAHERSFLLDMPSLKR